MSVTVYTRLARNASRVHGFHGVQLANQEVWTSSVRSCLLALMMTQHELQRRGSPLLVSVEEAAGLLGIGRSKCYELVSAGRIPSVLIGRCRRVPLSALEDFVSSLAAERG